MWNRLFRLVVVLLGLWLVFDLVAHLISEILWFQNVEYLPAFLTRLSTQLGVWVVVCSSSAFFLLGNLLLAQRLKYPKRPERMRGRGGRIPNSQFPIRLRLLLPVVLGLYLLIGLMLLKYSQVALDYWQLNFSLPSVTPPLPPPFEFTSAAQQLWLEISGRIWQLGVLMGVILLLLVNPEFWLSAIAVVLSLFFALILSGNWTRVLQYFNPTAFNQSDPLFGLDIGFYVFKLPIWQLLNFWLGGLFLYGLIAVSLTYVLSGDSFSQGKFPGFSRQQLRHLYALGGALMLSLSLHHWLSRYALLYSQRGVTYGAGYTNVKVQLPAETVLSLLAGAIALWLLLATFIRFRHLRTRAEAPLFVLGVYLTIAVTIGILLPAAVQRFSVQPNELERERPYIERSIALTREAFDLEDIEVETFNPTNELTAAVLEENELTIRNIRLWDTRPILQTNRQLQQIRLYYEFPDADIDRYLLKAGATGVSPIIGGQEAREERPEEQETDSDARFTSPSEPLATEKQQVHIASRELDYEAVPEQAKTWVNKHLIYTHGYGFTLSPVNMVANGGLPAYFVKDIGIGTNAAEDTLFTSSELIREYIPIYNPRIYYGELTNTYVMTSTRVKELDYASGDENVYTIYDGNGGVPIDSLWRRLLFAEYLNDWQMLFTRNFTPQTKVLFRRNINQRIRAIAPFLRYDYDPYIVTVDLNDTEPDVRQSHLYWIIDAYTTSDRYPYSDPGENKFNYIRNSVKAVIDAYHGNVTFYIADPSDPIIQTWSKIFPGLFKPLDTMPASLRRHIRYPQDFYKVQSERLLTYHMRDPQVFYNREDLWRIPQEIYGGEAQQVEPYYLIMKLPTAESEEFILLQPYTPVARNNLIGWLAARSDGEQYGNLLLYQFPKQELVYGPEQVEALVNQNPVISEQISLWNRQGSRAIQGNLLVIPVKQSLLYVEPVYLEATENSLPTLVRVIVVYENRIVMAETLEGALQAIFEPDEAETPIIRPLEETPPTLEGSPQTSE